MSAQQEAASATVSVVPTEAADFFESRWSGLQKAEAGLAFNARWALDFSKLANKRLRQRCAFSHTIKVGSKFPHERFVGHAVCRALWQ